MTDPNARFAGTIPATYDRCLGPLLFEPSARDFVARLPWSRYRDVLELAAGTGILTHRLRQALTPDAHLTATDLNPDMLAIAKARYPGLPVTWEPADAQSLPFPDAAFDAVACQYGIMFFPDKPAACREVRRVLRRDGLFAFSVWDSLDHNPFGAIARETVNRYFTSDPPTFYDVPFGFSDPQLLRGWLEPAGFEVVSIDTVPMTNESPSALEAAEGMVGGNPTLLVIQERATATVEVIVEEAARTLGARYGHAPCRLPMQAIVVVARAV